MSGLTVHEGALECLRVGGGFCAAMLVSIIKGTPEPRSDWFSVPLKKPPASAGDSGWIPGLGRSPGEGTGNPLQYSCLGNPMDRVAWWAIVQIGRAHV